MSTTTSRIVYSPRPFYGLFRKIVKFALARRRRVPPGLTNAQLKDAGIAWELAGYGRGADVSMLTITNLQSLR